MESQEELYELLEKFFNEKDFIDYKKFLYNIENIGSEVYFYIFTFLLENKPFSKLNVMQYEKQIPLVQFKTNDPTNKNFNSYIEKAKTIQGKKPSLIATPTLNSKLSPSVTLSKSPAMRKKMKEISIENFDLKLSIVENHSNSNNKDQKNVSDSIITDYFVENAKNSINSIKPANTITYLSISNNNNNNSNKKNNEKSLTPKNKTEIISSKKNLLTKMKSNTILKTEINKLRSEKQSSSKKLPGIQINGEAIEINLSNEFKKEGSKTNRENTLMNKMKNSVTSQMRNNILNLKSQEESSENIEKEDLAKKEFDALNFYSEEDSDSEDDRENEVTKVKGYLYKLTDINKMKRLWFGLFQKDLYCKKLDYFLINFE